MSKYTRHNGEPAPKGNNPAIVGWKAQLQKLIDENAGRRVDGRVASHRTREITSTEIFAAFNTLHNELGMRLESPLNFREEHVRRLVNHWHYTEHLAPNTMRTNLAILRKFSVWIGKKSMIKPLPAYLPDVPGEELEVRSGTKEEKSWSTNGVDVEAKIDEAFKINEQFGLLLWTQVTFGLRIQEALCLKPWKADNGRGLMVYPGDGPKGGRPRFIPYLVPEQKVVMDYIKSRVKKTHWLGWQFQRRGQVATLMSNTNEYYRRMREIGVTKKLCGATGHGLRAEFSETMAKVKGFCPATMGGTGDQMPWDELQAKVAEVSELMGHSRTQVMASYFGAFKRPKGEKKATYVGVLAGASAKTLPKDPIELAAANETKHSPNDRDGQKTKSGKVDNAIEKGAVAHNSKTVASPPSHGHVGSERGTVKAKPVDARQLKLPLKDRLLKPILRGKGG